MMIAAPVMSHSMSEQGGGNINCFYYDKSKITFTCRINTTANHVRKDTNVLTWRSYFFLWYYEMKMRLLWGANNICDAKETLSSINCKSMLPVCVNKFTLWWNTRILLYKGLCTNDVSLIFDPPPSPVRIYRIEITQPPPPIVRNWLTPPEHWRHLYMAPF